METLYEKPLNLELSNYVLFVNGKANQRSVRTLRDMSELFVDGLKTLEFGNSDLYYMYRDVYKKNDVRFDVTCILAKMIGREYAKTHGHYHPSNENGFSYPEVYQVLRGQAAFILQKKNHDESIDVAVVDANEGDVLLIPPGFGHVTANRGKKDLVLSNLVYDNFDAIYHDYQVNRGAACYYLMGGELVSNTNYIVRKNERYSVSEWDEKYDFVSKNIFAEFYKSPESFRFLGKPELFFKEKPK